MQEEVRCLILSDSRLYNSFHAFSHQFRQINNEVLGVDGISSSTAKKEDAAGNLAIGEEDVVVTPVEVEEVRYFCAAADMYYISPPRIPLNFLTLTVLFICIIPRKTLCIGTAS